jgi:penicillin-binding protein 1A
LINSNLSIRYLDWRVGVVLRRGGSGQIGFADGRPAALMDARSGARGRCDHRGACRDGVYACAWCPVWAAWHGGKSPEQPRAAMAGGFDAGWTVQPRHPGPAPARLDDQALRLCHRARQRHDARLDGPDQSFCVYQGAALGQKCFRNFGRRRAASTRCAGALNSRAT